ncbi:OLC1v1032909C1 [Oldenlandia corymbosa var. corymbosa]|uniref:Endoglucanase n=1 Tax=Oldenlandia corymbosa var. corymbosa TaxID=529605 RepID=A0AAV1CQ56_OLDCO|nr:OLC1v1032909C1 [Oldenlandia corymbosa var. corymbosa]
MDPDGGSSNIFPMDPLVPHGMGAHFLSHVTSFIDCSKHLYVSGSTALDEAVSCVSKVAGGLLIWFARGSNLNNTIHRTRRLTSRNPRSITQLKPVFSGGSKSIGVFGNCRSDGMFGVPFAWFSMKQLCKEAHQIFSFSPLLLAAALIPPLNNVCPVVMAVPVETAELETQSCLCQRPSEIEHQRSSCINLRSLSWAGHAVEPRTGVVFPTVLENIAGENDNSNFSSEILVGTGSRIMKIIRIKSLKVYAFGFYIHPEDVCEKLGPKYASLPFSELNKSGNFYEDLLREDINMTVRLVVSCNGIKFNTVKEAFEKSLRARLQKALTTAAYKVFVLFFKMTFLCKWELQSVSAARLMDVSLLKLGTTSSEQSTARSYARQYILIWVGFLNGVLLLMLCGGVNGEFNYQDALSKSIIFLEAQRSGKLPPNHRPSWRGDSGLQDGKLAGVDLVGGYYDAGDNVKYGLPMAFTVTTLSWAAIFYQSELQSTGELKNVHSAIRWGTDYLLKASFKRNILYVQDGNPNKDHECWMRPENMNTPRTVLQIDQNRPGTEIAAETSAALAASSIVFRHVDNAYSRQLVKRAKNIFQFAKTYKGTYDGECPFYCSFSGYNDELLWAATWLFFATKSSVYLDYIKEEAITATVSEFSWDIKYAGAQVLLSELYWKGDKELSNYKQQADNFVCSILPDSPSHQVYITPGGMIHLRDGANTQYVTSTAFLFSAYSDLLAKHNQQVNCGNKAFTSSQLMAFAKQQMDYLLGKNPLGRSYMVGFGQNPPRQAHHRGASVPKTLPNKEVSCPMTFTYWFNKNVPNPNELTGAIVGGPDRNDKFVDQRSNSVMTEPTTYTNSLAIGVLAKLAKHHSSS